MDLRGGACGAGLKGVGLKGAGLKGVVQMGGA